MKAIDKIKRARVQLNDFDTGSPFFGHLTMHLDLVETDRIPTMAVDYNGNMYYNPEFVKQMTDEEIKGVVCHEVMHIALHGKMRKEGRKDRLWNLAQDVVINYILKQNNFSLPTEAENPQTGETSEYPVPHGNSIDFPQGFTINNLEDHSFESVYDILQDNIDELPSKVKVTIKQDGDGDGQQSGSGQQPQTEEEGEDNEDQENGEGSGSGDKEDEEEQSGSGQGDQQEEVIEIEIDAEELGDNPLGIDDHIYEGDEDGEDGKDWEQIMAEAMSQAKQRGEMPAGMERRVDQVLEPDVAWQTILQRYLSQKISVDFTYQRPSRKTRALRRSGINTYLPDVRKEGLEVAVAVDLSGSIGNKELAHYLGEIKDIAGSFEQVDMTIIQHDAKVTKVDDIQNVRPSDIENLELSGGGGTNHIPVFEEVEENMNNAEILICLTDGYTQTPDEPPQGLDVMWVIDNHNVDEERLGFGDIVRAEYHD